MRGPLDVHGVELDRFTDWMLWGLAGWGPALWAKTLAGRLRSYTAGRNSSARGGASPECPATPPIRCAAAAKSSAWPPAGAGEIACRLGDMAGA